jgi:hypothetical protein
MYQFYLLQSGVIHNFLSSKYCILLNGVFVIICYIKIIYIMLNPQASY